MNINSYLQIHRAKFSSVDKREIQEAFSNPVTPNIYMNDAVMVRQELDFRSGVAFTRFQTHLLQRNFPKALMTKIVSYGSCQFPTLYFVVERYIEFINFQSKTFYHINLVLKKGQFEVPFNWDRVRLFDKYISYTLYEYVMESPEAKVISVSKKETIKYKPYPLTTVDFQKMASSKLKISAQEAMDIAEKLY